MGVPEVCGATRLSWLWVRALSDRSRSESMISASDGYACDDRKVKVPCGGFRVVVSLGVIIVGSTWGSGRAGDDVRGGAVVGDNLVAL